MIMLCQKMTDSILEAMNNKINKAPYNKTITARVVKIIKSDKQYKISYAGKEYNVQSYVRLSVGDVVKVIVPNNDFSNLFVVASDSLQRQIDEINKKLN